jgi:hypothetical protein
MGSLVKSIGGSNAPSAKEGFTKVDYPGQRPAMSNADVSSTKEFGGSLGNDGTNMSAYEEQVADISPENGK